MSHSRCCVTVLVAVAALVDAMNRCCFGVVVADAALSFLLLLLPFSLFLNMLCQIQVQKGHRLGETWASSLGVM